MFIRSFETINHAYSLMFFI